MKLPQGLQPIVTTPLAYLEHSITGRCFYIDWQPFIIGRSEEDIPETMEYLGVDTRPLSENDRRISRQHAHITINNADFQIESIRPNNLAYLNGEAVPVAAPISLNDHDLIQIRSIDLLFHFDKANHSTS